MEIIMAQVNRPRYSRRPNQNSAGSALSDKQIRRITETANATPGMQVTGTIIAFLSGTGLRSRELMNLRMSDIDEGEGTIRISSESSLFTRYIPLSLEAAESLRALCAQRGDSEFVLGSSAQ
jgi:integrase